MVQQEIHGYVLGLTSQQKKVCYLYGPGHLKFKFGQAYEEQFHLLPFDTSVFTQLQPIVGSAPELPQAQAMRLYQAVTPFVGVFDDSGKGKKLTAISGPGSPPVQQAPPPQPVYQNGGPAVAPPPPQQNVWYPREDSEWALYEAVTEQNLNAWGKTYEKVVAQYPQSSDEFQRQVTTAVVIETSRQIGSLRGYALGKVAAPPDPRDSELLLRVEPSKLPGSLFDAIASLHPHINAAVHAKNIVKLFGHSSVSPNDTGVWLDMAHQAWDYADLRDGGMEEDEAKAAVIKKYGLPGDWL